MVVRLIMQEKECKLCKNKFVKRVGHQIFCSTNCRLLFYIPKYKLNGLPNRNCEICNTPLLFTKFSTKRRFCSISCLNEHDKNINKDKVNQELIKIRNCLYCGKEFTGWDNYKIKKYGSYKYCSRECCKANNNYIPITKEKLNYSDHASKTKSWDFYGCYYYDKENFGGNRLWALIRDNFKCIKCNSSNNLTIHHKDGKGFNVAIEHRNNNIDNLVTLCQYCHNSEEKGELEVENYVPRVKIKEALRM